MEPVFIIAEAGVNHNGSLDIAEKLVDAAVDAGADAVKFQAFKAVELSCQKTPMAEYQIRNIKKKESQLKMLQDLELDRKSHFHLMEYCRRKKIIFMSSPFDLESINLLISLGIRMFKIPSGEITNIPYLEKIGSQKKKVIMSTGMADMQEVEFAVNILKNKGTLAENIALLHCCTEYPVPFSNVNLNAMKSMGAVFPQSRIGYSDHTMGIEIPIAAAAMGAQIIEKHFTMDKTMDGPDHVASIEPHELKGMVCAIRNIEKAMGDGIKKAQPAEMKNKTIVRKSIVAGKNIKKGEIFSHNNLKIKRPGSGISPIEWYNVIGQTAKKNFKYDDLIRL